MNKLFIIKIGGNVLDDPSALSNFLKDFSAIREPKILIHGGGKIATKIGDQLGIESNYLNGRRITDNETLDLVTMVYGGLVNKKIVAQLISPYGRNDKTNINFIILLCMHTTNFFYIYNSKKINYGFFSKNVTR